MDCISKGFCNDLVGRTALSILRLLLKGQDLPDAVANRDLWLRVDGILAQCSCLRMETQQIAWQW